MLCDQCNHLCLTCPSFEGLITVESDPLKLKEIRRALAVNILPVGGKISERFADFIVSKVGTMPFFYLCIVLAMSPLLYPQSTTIVQYVSSSFLQLVLLPLIMIAQNRQDKNNQIKAEREYRMLLISDRIDELMDEK